jgi:thiol-disulfide isomerase/thioredoxin
MKKLLFLCVLATLSLFSSRSPAFAQDKPAKVSGKLPAKIVCFVCQQRGEAEEEKPAGALLYKGKTYYFCNKTEMTQFLQDPEAFMPAPLPRPAPNFSLATPSGEKVTQEALKGKLVLVDFWATWCVPCVKSMPEVQQRADKYKGKGLVVLGIAIDETGAKKVTPFLAKSKTKYTYPMLLDTGTVWQQWGAKIIPTLILVKDGQVIAQWTGKASFSDVDRVIEANLVP